MAKPAELARDKRQSVMQIAPYATDDSQYIVAGGDTAAFTYRSIMRIVNTNTTTVWMAVNTAASTGTGMALLAGTEIHIVVPKGEYLSFVDGDVNLTPLGE